MDFSNFCTKNCLSYWRSSILCGTCYICSLLLLNMNPSCKIMVSFYTSYFTKFSFTHCRNKRRRFPFSHLLRSLNNNKSVQDINFDLDRGFLKKNMQVARG